MILCDFWMWWSQAPEWENEPWRIRGKIHGENQRQSIKYFTDLIFKRVGWSYRIKVGKKDKPNNLRTYLRLMPIWKENESPRTSSYLPKKTKSKRYTPNSLSLRKCQCMFDAYIFIFWRQKEKKKWFKGTKMGEAMLRSSNWQRKTLICIFILSVQASHITFFFFAQCLSLILLLA